MENIRHASKKSINDFFLIQKAVLNDDQNAYKELLNRYYRIIYYRTHNMLKDKKETEDTTMEVFEKAFKNLDKYNHTYAFSTWLFKIAKNSCIDHIKKKKLDIFSIDEIFENNDKKNLTIDIKSQYLNPEEIYIKKQKFKIIHDLISKLNPCYKNVIELRYFKEFTYLEISDHLRVPVGTVKRRIHRAKKLLLTALKKQK